MKSIIVIQNVETNEYFFSTDHCQQHGLGEEFVPTTFYVPARIFPRESLPSGIIKDKEDICAVYLADGKEIPNPQKEFQG